MSSEVRGRGRKPIGWWREVLKVIREKDGGRFFSNLEKVVGDGSRPSFGDECWVGETPLKSRFRNLYNLSLDKSSSVSDMGEWREGSWS